MARQDPVDMILEARRRWRDIRLACQSANAALSDWGRTVTPDGHVVGSIGDVIAAAAFDVELDSVVGPSCDGFRRGTKEAVEIKTTGKSGWAFREPTGGSPHWVICMRVVEDEFIPEWHGPAAPIYDLVRARLVGEWGSGQRSVAASKLPSEGRRELGAVSTDVLEALRRPLEV